MPLNIFQSIPEVAALEQTQLQAYCDQWVQRPIAQKLGIAYFVVDSQRMLQVVLDADHAALIGSDVYIPFDELVGFIIDCHFADADERRLLHAQLREVRSHWPDNNHGVEVMVGRVGTLYLVCKNPACDIWMETSHKGVEGGIVECPPCEVSCPVCGHVDVYDGTDLRLNT